MRVLGPHNHPIDRPRGLWVRFGDASGGEVGYGWIDACVHGRTRCSFAINVAYTPWPAEVLGRVVLAPERWELLVFDKEEEDGDVDLSE